MQTPTYINVYMILASSAVAVAAFGYLRARIESTKERRWWQKSLFVFVALYSIHSVLALSGFYSVFSLPPRFPVAAMATLVIFILFGLGETGRSVLHRIGPDRLALFQVWRFLPEILILLLVRESLLPKAMTAAGRNFDLWIPVTASAMYYLRSRRLLPDAVLIVWNLLGILVLGFTVYTGLRSAPFPFNQPGPIDTSVLAQFPIAFLPLFMVPLAMFSHIAGITLLISNPGADRVPART